MPDERQQSPGGEGHQAAASLPGLSAEAVWNLQVEPVAYLDRLKKFCRENALTAEVAWYEKAITVLSG